MARCPVTNLRAEIIKTKKAREEEIIALEERIEKEVQTAVKFAAESDYPEASEAFTDVFLEGVL